MTHCERALALFLLPVVIGIAVGLIVSDRVLAALERAQRERRRAVTRVTREAEETELRWLIWTTAHERAPIIEWLYDGGRTERN